MKTNFWPFSNEKILQTTEFEEYMKQWDLNFLASFLSFGPENVKIGPILQFWPDLWKKSLKYVSLGNSSRCIWKVLLSSWKTWIYLITFLILFLSYCSWKLDKTSIKVLTRKRLHECLRFCKVNVFKTVAQNPIKHFVKKENKAFQMRLYELLQFTLIFLDVRSKMQKRSTFGILRTITKERKNKAKLTNDPIFSMYSSSSDHL